MNEEKRISIIIPVFNSECFLEECLESVVNQTYQNIEIILVNDGSSDRSPEICLNYARKDRRVVYITQENAGGSAARNVGLRAAQGEILMFLDSDDMLTLDICERVSIEMQDFDLMIMDHQVFNDAAEIKDWCSGLAACASDLSDFSQKDWMRSQLGPKKTVPATVNLNTVWAKAYRRQFVEDHGIEFPAKILLGEDMLFNLLVLLKKPKICSIPMKAYFYRYNSNSLAHKHIAAYHCRDSAFHKKLRGILEEEGLGENFTEEMDYQKMLGLLQAFSSDIFHWNNPKSVREKKAEFLKLVSREEYRDLILGQLKNFVLEKQIVLLFAWLKLYQPISIMYLIKNQIRKLN